MNVVEESIRVLKRYGIDASNFSNEEIVDCLDKIIDNNNLEIEFLKEELEKNGN